MLRSPHKRLADALAVISRMTVALNIADPRAMFVNIVELSQVNA